MRISIAYAYSSTSKKLTTSAFAYLATLQGLFYTMSELRFTLEPAPDAFPLPSNASTRRAGNISQVWFASARTPACRNPETMKAACIYHAGMHKIGAV